MASCPAQHVRTAHQAFYELTEHSILLQNLVFTWLSEGGFEKLFSWKNSCCALQMKDMLNINSLFGLVHHAVSCIYCSVVHLPGDGEALN